MTNPMAVRHDVGVPRAHCYRRIPIALAAALVLAITLPGYGLGRTTSQEQPARPAAAATPAFTLDLSAPGDFVAQKNFVQCVGASMQMMLNMIQSRDDRTLATQLDLQLLARSLSGERPDGRTRKGASVIGWAAGLGVAGGGAYRTVGAADLGETLKLAARAMRATNRPVGLLMWRGRHAWVMAGFSATADPRLTDDFTVTRVIVLDPLYPHGSRTWGASPKPRQAMTVAQLGRQFVPRGTRTLLPGGGSEPVPTAGPSGAPQPGFSGLRALAGKYVIVMPVALFANPRVSGSLP